MKKRRNKSLLVALLLLILTAVFGFSPERVEAAGKVQMKKAVIRLSKTVYTYNGKVQKPAVTVKYRGKKLKVNKDYTLLYSKGRKNPGVYTVTVKGKGVYTGTAKKTFRIRPVGAKLTSMQSPAGGNTLKLTWRRPSRAVSGYQIRYSTRKDFKGAKIQTISGATKTTTTLKSLKTGTRYYLQIRSFYRYAKTKSVYSGWSKLTAKTTAKKADSSGNNGTPDNGNTGKTDNDQKNDTKETEPPKSDNDQKETSVPETEKPKDNLNPDNSQKESETDRNNGNQDSTEKETETKPSMFRFINPEDVEINTTVGKEFYIFTNNNFEKLENSNPDILVQTTKNPTDYSGFLAVCPGQVTLTFTDSYGQKLVSTVTIREKLYVGNVSTEVVSVKYDVSLPIPEISNVHCNSSYIGVICPGTFSSTDSYEGYELWLSKTPDFTKFFKSAYATKQWNQRGFAQLSFYGTDQASVYYLKVRSFRLDGAVKVCGPWSSLRRVSVGNYKQEGTAEAQYSYHLYFLNQMDLYTDCAKAVFIKTDNPDPDTIQLLSNGKSVLQYIIKDGGNSQYYADIDYLNPLDSDNDLHKVKGGYIGYLKFTDAGTYSAELHEVQETGYVTVKKIQWTVKDYETAREAWMKKVIADNTNASMTSLEKMKAVCDYLKERSPFRYLTISDGWHVDLAAEPNAPYFIAYRWDSFISPAQLCLFAELIGGFDDIHNCYNDGENWQNMHSYVRVRVGETERYYSVCPSTDTGIVDTTKLDLTDPSKLYSAE